MSLAQAAESIPSGQGQSNNEESTTSNFISGLQMNNYLEQKFQHNMLLSSYTAVALALAKHRPNGEKTRAQRKQGNYCSNVVVFASGVVEEEPKLRRNRTAFNDNQLDKLESCFQSCQYPTVAIRDRLAKGKKKESIDPFKTVVLRNRSSRVQNSSLVQGLQTCQTFTDVYIAEPKSKVS